MAVYAGEYKDGKVFPILKYSASATPQSAASVIDAFISSIEAAAVSYSLPPSTPHEFLYVLLKLTMYICNDVLGIWIPDNICSHRSDHLFGCGILFGQGESRGKYSQLAL